MEKQQYSTYACFEKGKNLGMKVNRIILLLMCISITLCGCNEEKQDQNNTLSEDSPTGIMKEDHNQSSNIKPTEEVRVTPAETASPSPAQGQSKVNEFVNGSPILLGNTQANLLASGYVCEYNGHLIYRDMNHDNALCMSNVDGTGKTVLSEDFARAIQVVDGYVYYIEDDAEKDTYGRIKRVALDGTDVEYIGEEKAGTMFVTEDRIYFSSQNYIGVINPDGTLLYKLGEQTGNDFGWLCIYGDCLMGSGVANGMKMDALKLDGSGVTRILDFCLFPYVDGDSLYYVSNKGGLSVLSLITGEEKAWNMENVQRSAIWNQWLIYNNSNSIGKIDLETGVDETIYPWEKTEQVYLESYGIALNRLFFTEKNRDTGVTLFKSMDLITGEVVDVP